MEGRIILSRIILALLIAVYAVCGVLYAVATPKWQAPDEPAHYNYIRTIAETGALPVLRAGDYDPDYMEKIKAAKFPPHLSIDPIRYESYQPPLYYVAAVPVYLVARAGGVDAQVLALRLFSVLLGAFVLALAYRIVYLLTRDRRLALAVVALMATVPMHIAVTGSISNDTAAELVLALILLLALLRARGEVPARRYWVLGGVLYAAALLTKSTTYVPGAALLIAAEGLSPRSLTSSPGRGRRWVVLLPLFLLAAAISSPMFLRNFAVYGVTDPLGMGRHDAIVIGQPTTAEMIGRAGWRHVASDFAATSFRSFWAQFGWMGVLLDDRLYVALLLLSAAAGLGLVFYVIRLGVREPPDAAQRAGLILATLLLATALLDYIGYNFKFYQPQGRYLFPALVSIAFFCVTGWREITAREHARALAVLLYLGLVALDFAALFQYIVPQLRVGN